MSSMTYLIYWDTWDTMGRHRCPQRDTCADYVVFFERLVSEHISCSGIMAGCHPQYSNMGPTLPGDPLGPCGTPCKSLRDPYCVYEKVTLCQRFTEVAKRVPPRFCEFCYCCCLPLLPELACSILETWQKPY